MFLYDCASKDHVNAELLLVLSDSAYQAARSDRDRMNQALLQVDQSFAFTGKLDEDLDNERCKKLIASLGIGIMFPNYPSGFDKFIAPLRYGKIIIVAEQGEVGERVRDELLRFCHMYMPPVITAGHVFIPEIALQPRFTHEQFVSSILDPERRRLRRIVDKGTWADTLAALGEDVPSDSPDIIPADPKNAFVRTPLPTPEEALGASKSQDERFYTLGRAATSRFNASDFKVARVYALELQKMLPDYQGNPNYGNAVASANIVLGRLALREGKVDEAESFLIEAGKSPGSPSMDTFGPNMRLAQDLLIAGHSTAVLEYFKLCANFWSSEFSELDKWTEDVNAGRLPDFSANLVYGG